MATKLRALYQRRKGRDLFDLWYVTKNNLINLELKRYHQGFQSDMNALLPTGLKWNFDEAYQFVLDNIIRKLP